MKISIIGAAGTIGSTTAFILAHQGLANEIVLFDLNKNLLKCHVMDISTAVSCLQDTAVREGNEDGDLSGSDIVVMAASVPNRFVSSRLEYLSDNINIIKDTAAKIRKYCPEALVVTVTNPIDSLNYAMFLSVNTERKKFIGYSLNDSIRFRMLTARTLNKKSKDLNGLVIGEHGENQVLLWKTLTDKGCSISIDDDPLKVEIERAMANVLSSYENLKTGRTTGWTSGTGVSFIVKAIYDNTKEVIPCSAILSGEYGGEDISLGVPAVIGAEGVEKILELELDDDERKRMQKAIDSQKMIAKEIRELLKK